MTSSTPSIERHTPVVAALPGRSLAGIAGFTLVELLVAATLSGIIMAGVLSTFLMMGRSGANVANYTVLDQEARRALELFGQDVRMAQNVNWNGATPSAATSVTLTIPDDSGTHDVTYFYDPAGTSSTYQCFLRRPGDATSTDPAQVLIHNVRRFGFNAFKIGSTTAAINALETKQIQLSLTAVRSSTTAVAASDMVLSARFILRNKRSAL